MPINIQRPSGINVGVNNPGTTVYIKGSEFVDGSFRHTLNAAEEVVQVQERVAGVWVKAPIEFSISSWIIDGITGQIVINDLTGELVLEG